MKVRFLGTGGAFDLHSGNSAALVDFRGAGLLLDCGHTVFPALLRKGLADQVTHLLLTHTHDDHCGSVGSLLYYHHFRGRNLQVLLADEAHEAEVRQLLRLVVRFPERFADLVPLSQLPGLRAIPTLGLHFPEMPTYAFWLDDGQERLLYSGDLGHPSILREWLQAESLRPDRIFHEASWQPVPGVHCHYPDLVHYRALAPTWLYHCDVNAKPPDCPLPHVAEWPELLA